RWPVAGQGDTGNLWNSVTFSSPTNQTSASSISGDDDTKAMMIDVNGDGLPDRVARELNPGSWTGSLNDPGSYDAFAIQLNNGAGFEPLEYWQINNQGQTSTQWGSPIAEERTTNQGPDSNNPAYGWGTVCALVDINGDGLVDRVMRPATRNADFNPDTALDSYDRFLVQVNTGSGFAA